MEGGEGDKPDLEIVHSSDTVKKPAGESEEDYATIVRNLTRQFSTLPPDQARVMWARKRTNSLEEAIADSGFSADEFKRLFDEANKTLYGEPQTGPKAAEKPGHPSRSGRPKKEPTTGEADIIPFPKPPEPDKPSQP